MSFFRIPDPESNSESFESLVKKFFGLNPSASTPDPIPDLVSDPTPDPVSDPATLVSAS